MYYVAQVVQRERNPTSFLLSFEWIFTSSRHQSLSSSLFSLLKVRRLIALYWFVVPSSFFSFFKSFFSSADSSIYRHRPTLFLCRFASEYVREKRNPFPILVSHYFTGFFSPSSLIPSKTVLRHILVVSGFLSRMPYPDSIPIHLSLSAGHWHANLEWHFPAGYTLRHVKREQITMPELALF